MLRGGAETKSFSRLSRVTWAACAEENPQEVGRTEEVDKDPGLCADPIGIGHPCLSRRYLADDHAIPEIGLDVIMVEGTTTGALRRGPGHWSETPMPGLGGNFVISGHRTTYGGPFLRLDRLNQGDVIRVALPYVLLEYRVTRKLIVSPDEVNVVAQRGVEELSLTTCHPIYSAKQRLIIQAKMVTLRPLEGDPAGS